MAGGEKDSVTLWSLESGEVLQELQGVSQTCNCVLLTPDARLLVTAGYAVLADPFPPRFQLLPECL